MIYQKGETMIQGRKYIREDMTINGSLTKSNTKCNYAQLILLFLILFDCKKEFRKTNLHYIITEL